MLNRKILHRNGSSMYLAERYRAGCNEREKAIIPDDAIIFAKEVAKVARTSTNS